MEGKKILIIEDDKSLADALKLKFESEGYIGFVSNNGEEGYEKIANENPDMVLLDIDLPILNGIELIKKLEDKNIKANIILLTNSDKNEHMAEALEHNVTRYILKSDNTLDSVVEKVNTFFAS